jgi:large subunit ribosomal protein L18
MDHQKAKRAAVVRIKRRIRQTVAGSAERPRLSVYRSEKHIYGQIVDDGAGKTLFAASDLAKDVRDKLKELKPLAAAKAVGEALAAKAVAGGVTKVVFDRNGRQFGGRLKAFADGARAKGLQF